jgi:dihydropteroate synthase
MLLKAGWFTLQFPAPTVVMGVVNVTPDSFSDGGRYLTTEAAVIRALELRDAGAGILDVGGESTRPGAEPVSEPEERRRVLPVIEALSSRVGIPLSVDTLKPSVARDAVSAGASIINDVGANREKPEPMWELVADSRVGYVCMHMQGSPRTMQVDPQYGDVVEEVALFFENQLSGLMRSGVKPEQVILDVGIGFGKTPAHNLQLLTALGRFRKFHRPMLLGASRKSFIGKLFGTQVEDRLPGSIACACWAALNGAHILRVHDVSETIQAVRLTEAIAKCGVPPVPHQPGLDKLQNSDS